MAQGMERFPLAYVPNIQVPDVRVDYASQDVPTIEYLGEEPVQQQSQPAPASMGVGDTLSSLGRNVWDAVVYHTPAAVAAAVEGDDPYATSDWKDALINRARQRAQEVSKPGDANTKTAIPGITAQDINSLGPSAGFSAAGAAAGLGAGIPAGMVASPVAGYAAGMAASGTAAYRMATNQFVRDLHDTVNAESLKTTGKPASPQEFQAKQAQLADTIKAYGLWEAVPEAAGNALSFGILTAPVKGAIGKLFGKNIATRFAGKLGALYGEELATETVTQMGQHNAEVDAGMVKAPKREFTSPQDWNESLKEVAGPTMLQTTLMAGGFKAGQMAKDRLMGNAEVDQPDNAIPADDIGAGPGSGGPGAIDGEFIPAEPMDPRRGLSYAPQGATYDQNQPTLPPGQPLLAGPQPMEGDVLGPESLPAGQALLDKPAIEGSATVQGGEFARPMLPAPEDGGPSERQVSTAIGLLKHSPKASPELLQRLMRVDQTMATMLFNHWKANGQVTGNQATEIPAPGDQGQGADIAGSRVVGGFSDGAVSFTPGAAAEGTAPGGKSGMAMGATGPDAVTPLDVQAHAAATSPFNATPQPTEAQKQAGNYAKGHVKFQGMDIAIENPAGSVRSGTNQDGKAWENTLAHHYGYIKGSTARDGDQVDVFIKPGAQTARTAYVIDQIDPKTGKYDEAKVILGADSEADAQAIYHANYQEGWQGFGAMTAMPMDEFKAWVKSGKTKKPLAYVEPKGVSHEKPVPKAKAPVAIDPSAPYGKVGVAPFSSQVVGLKDNGDGTATVMRGEEPFYDFENGDPVTVPTGATAGQIRQTVADAGALSSRDKWFGVAKAETKPAETGTEPTIPPEQDPAADVDFRASIRAEFRHEGFRIYPISIKGEARWAVQSLDNAEKEQKGERQIGGDAIVDTAEQAKKQAEDQVTERAKKAERQRQFAEQDAANEAKKEANRGLSITERRANAALDKPTNLPVNAGVGRGSRREAMESAVSQGRAIVATDVADTAAYKRDEDEQGRLHRAGYGAFFGNDSHPQKMRFNELSAKLKNRDNYQKKEYRLYSGRDTEGSFYEITKTEYDYAKSLMTDSSNANPVAAIAGKPVSDMPAEQLQKIASGESKTFGPAAVEKASAELARRDEVDSPKESKEPWQYGELEFGDKYIDETVLPDLRKQLANAHGGKFQEYPSKAAAVRGLKERIDTLENHRDAKARKYYASLDNHYGAVRAALADGKPVPPVAYESYEDLKADIGSGRIKGDGQEVARVEQPQHIEAGQAEPATAPVIAASLKESAKNTPMNIEQAREWLLSEIDKAIIDAKSAKEEGIWNRADDKVNLEGIMDVGATIGFKTFNVPGDGKFRVLNLKESLQKFKKQVAASPGFKKNATRPMSLASGNGGKTSVRDLLDDGEYVLAADYGHLTGKPLLFGSVREGEAHPIAYTDAEPIDIKGINAQVGREWNATGKSLSWRVIETTTGLSVASESTKEKAISKALAHVDEHGTDKLKAIIAESQKVSQAELERQFTDWGSEEEAKAQKQRDAVERSDSEDRALWNSIWPLSDGEKRSPNPWNDIDHLQVVILAQDAAKVGKADEFVSLIERRRGGTNNVLALAARKALADAAPKAKPSKGAVTTGVASKILGDIYQRAAYNKWTWDRLKSYLTRELEEAGVGKSRMANALEKAMTEYARTANGRLGYPNSNLVFSAMRDYGLITEDAPDAQQKPGVDYKGFERTPTGNGNFTLKDGNLLVKVEAMGSGKFQASHGSAKSSPHINSEQGAVDWAANLRDASKKTTAYPFYSNNKLFNAEGTAELPKDWTGVARSDSGKRFFYLGQENGERSFNPLKAESYEDALKEADGLKNDKPAVPDGYREVARGYFGGTVEKPIYAPFAEGDRVRFIGGHAGNIQSFIGGPVTTGAIIKYDNGLTGRAEWRDVETAPAASIAGKPVSEMSDGMLNQIAKSSQPAAEKAKAEVAKRKKPKADPLAAVREFYTPGNIIHVDYWNQYDKVLEFKEGDLPGQWNVKVQQVKKDGDQWVPKDDRMEPPRWHATAPGKDKIVDRVPTQPPSPADAAREDAQDQARRENPDIKTTLAEHDATVDRLRDGTATLAEYKAAFQRLQNSTEELTAEFAAMKKDDILKHMGGMAASRYKSDTKAQVVTMAVRDLMDDFSIGRGISYTMGGRDAYANAVRAQVERTTDADLAEYAEHVKSMRAARTERVAQMTGAMKDPKTLADFKMYVDIKAGDTVTREQARMMLTPEQRVAFDELAAEQSREERKGRADQQRTEVRAPGEAVGASEIIKTKHTKHGHDLWQFTLERRVPPDEFKSLVMQAKRMGGDYSSYRGNGAIPGWQFRTEEAAIAFRALVAGDTTAAKEVMQTRRDDFEDDRSQTAVERLTEMADRLEERADESLNRDRKENTDRRARMAASAEAAANSDKSLAKTMRNIAQAIESGKTKFLDRVRQKAQVEMLRGFLHTAKANELRAKFPSYADQEKHRGAPPTAETADYVDFPRYTAFRSDLATMGRQMLDIDGAKKVGTALLKVADDVSAAYLAFAKEHLHQVSTFKTGAGEGAVFASKDDAEAAIKRSGFKGKAVVLPFKRGQNIIIMSPSAAKESGIWKGDDDKRITLSPDFGEEVVAKVKEFSGHRISMPYLFESVRAERARLKSIGIETAAELRAALREFMDLRAAPPEVDKIKQMERAMIGRKNDGLDFFPTPASVADELVQAAGIEEGMAVLEPSAGMGHIAERIRAAGVDPDVVEMASDRRELLEAKGFRLVGADFMDMSPRGFTYGDVFRAPDGTLGVMRGSGGLGSNRVGLDPLDANGQPEPRRMGWYDRDELEGVEKRAGNSGYDRIIMNPPFSDRRDAEHVQHAYTLLKPGGRLVAIMGEGVFFGQDKKAQAFRDWLEEVGGTSEKLEEGTFLDPSLPVNTGVNARMVVIEKGDGGVIAEPSSAAPGQFTSPKLGTKFANAREAVEWLAQNMDGEDFRHVAQKILPVVRSAPIHYVSVGDTVPAKVAELLSSGSAAVAYQAGDITDGKDAIYVLEGKGDTEEGLLHEALHIATSRRLLDATAAAEFSDITKAIRSSLYDAGAKSTDQKFKQAIEFFRREFRSPGELVAYGFSNPAFQDLLKLMAADGKFYTDYRSPAELAKVNKNASFQPQKRIPTPAYSMWHRFVDAVRALFGGPKAYQEAYERALAANAAIDRNNELASRVEFKTLEEKLHSLLDALLQRPELSLSKGGAAQPIRDGGLESRSSSTGFASTESTRAIQSIVNKFLKQFAGAAALDIRVVRTVADIPERFRPSPFAEGTFNDDAGLIYLVAMNLKHANGQVNTGRVWQVLMHEAVGHAGLAKMMGSRFGGILKEVMRAARAKGEVGEDIYEPGHPDYATVEAVRLRYTTASDEVLAEEVLARMAETDPGRTLFGYVRAVVRQWLRDMARAAGITLDVTTAELNDLVAQASRYMRRGDGVAQGVDVDALGVADMAVGGMASRGAVSSAPTFGPVDTASTAFKRWFGDSKVVDAKGRPLVVYHGTLADFAEFDQSRLGGNTRHPTSRLGFWFSSSPDVADLFTQQVDESVWPPKLQQRQNANTMPVYLAIRNPFILTVEKFREINGRPFGEEFENEQPLAAEKMRQWIDANKASLVTKGYDGIKVEGDPKYAESLGGEEYAADAWVAFRPEQIKSAISNTGSFSGTVITESRSRSTGFAPTESTRAIQSIVDKFLKQFAGAADLDIRVVRTVADIPERFRPSPFAEGVFHDDAGLIYLITMNLKHANGQINTGRAWQVLMHEAVGHFGLAKMMGSRFGGILKEVMRAARAKGEVGEDIYEPGHPDYATMEAVKLRYPEASDEEVAQEVLARMAETDPGRTLFGYVRAVVRQWLRDMARAAGITLDVTTAELNDLVAQASRYMRRGDGVAQGVDVDALGVADMAVGGMASKAEPMTERKFYSQYVQHIDLRGAKNGTALSNREAILRDGFKKGANVNAVPPYQGGKPLSVVEAAYRPRVGDVVYLAPKSAWKHKANGVEIQDGWKPEEYEAIVITDESKSMYENYIDALHKVGAGKTASGGMESRAAPAAGQPKEPRTGILDTILRKAGGELAAKITGPAYDKLTAYLGGKVPEGIKAGMVSDYGLDESYVDRRTGMQTEQQKAARQTKTFVEGLMDLDRAQSRVAYQWLNNRGAEADRLMAQLPQESQQVLKDIKIQIAKLTIEAVRLGQLDAETASRNFLAYLHRSYAKYDLNTDDKTWKAERAKAIKILGDQYKGRGLKMDVDPDRIHSAPGWWQDEMKGKRVQVLKNAAGRFAFVAEGTAIPPNLSGYKVEGVWEIRARKAADRITLWRDFTQDERQMMGELDEAKYAVARTLFMMNRDIEVGRFHEWVADEYAKTPEEAEDEGLLMADASDSMMRAFTPDEWVTVPTSKIPGTGVFKYGALAGMVVPGPVWNDIRQISAGGNQGPFIETWKSILRAWKLSKTALTPTTHVNNIMGNFVMADMHDVGARDAIAAVRLMVAAANGDKDAKAMLDRFEDSGATQGMFTTHELKKEVLEPLLQQLREEVGMADDEAAILKVSAIMSLALHGKFGEAWAGAKAAAKQSTAGRVTGAVVTKAQDYYQAEDSVFRLAAFLKSIDEGKTDLEAGKLSRKAFLDYHINAPWINAMRGTAMPFIAFAYRAIPMLAETAARKPWKIAKYMLVAGGLNALAYAMLGADGDEDKERAYLPDEKAGRLWGIVPKLVRMPWNRESKLRDGRTTSDPVFLDVRRWIPVGDVVDYGQDKTALPMIPQPLMPGGPLVIAAEFLVNKSAFTGKDLTKETDTWVEKAAKVGGHFYKGFAPNVPIPYSGTWAGTKIDNAVKGKEDPLGRAYPVPEAIASGFGLKFERYPVDTLQRNAVLDMKGKLRELSDAQRQAARDYGRQGMTKRELDEKVGEIVGKKNAAVEEYKAKERKAMGR